MKLKGKKLTLADTNFEWVVFPRPNGGRLVFKAAAILDESEFAALCPEPQPPEITRRGESQASADLEDMDYLKAREKWIGRYINWRLIKSLSATPDLEWETVKMTDPTTWEGAEQEFKASGLTRVEIAKLHSAVRRANSLDDAKLEEARKSFLREVEPVALQ